MTSVLAFIAGLPFGAFLFAIVLVAIREIAQRRAILRSVTAEAREEGQRFARAVGPSISTPVPVKLRIVAGEKRERGPFAAGLPGRRIA